MTSNPVATARVAVLLLLVAVLAAAISAGLARVVDQEVLLGTRTQHAIARLLGAVSEAEADQRGFLATGDAGYLTAYAAAAGTLRDGIRSLRELAAGDEDRSRQIATIAQAVDTRLELHQADAADIRAGRRDAAIARMRGSEQGETTLRLDIVALQDNLEGAIARRQSIVRLFENLLFVSIIAATCISLVVLRQQGRLMRANMDILRVGAERLRAANAGLEAAVSARTGELSEAKKRAETLATELTDHVDRFNLTLRGADVIAFTQDHDLVSTWVSHDAPRPGLDQILGLSQQAANDDADALKRQVLNTGTPARTELPVEHEGAVFWYELRVEPVREEGRVIGLMGVLVETTERRERETRIQLLLREITHRSKNLLAVIQSMARQTAQRTVSPTAFVNVFAQRIQSLAASHDLLLQSDWTGASLRRVLQAQLAPFADMIASRIEYDGPELTLKPEAAQGLGMAIHELVTNAAKFGALSVPNGKIQAVWSVAQNDNEADGSAIRFEWRERDMPKATRPERRGFGHVVLESATARALSGTSSFTYAPDGATWRLDIPGEWIEAPSRPGEGTQRQMPGGRA